MIFISKNRAQPKIYNKKFMMVPGKAREKQAALKLFPSFWLFKNQPYSYLETPNFSLY